MQTATESQPPQTKSLREIFKAFAADAVERFPALKGRLQTMKRCL